MTKIFSILFLLLFHCFSMRSQSNETLSTPVKSVFYSTYLNDSVSVEIILPKEYKTTKRISYPVFYLLDKQNTLNYNYNLHTIDYLNSFGSIPQAIIIGISFDSEKRATWTTPNVSEGKADDLINFITKELDAELKKEYRISDFKLLIGHSRTAIFSIYALSKKPTFFSSVIAGSASNFDFNDPYQKQQFKSYLDTLAKSDKTHFLYFSAGFEKNGDLHEKYCDSLDLFLKDNFVPANLQWKYYKLHANHITTPSQTVLLGLTDMFSDYERCLQKCFYIVNDSTNRSKVPWDKYLGEFKKLSTHYGYEVQPGLSFFLSIASVYENDYRHLFKEKSLRYSEEIIDKGLELYPNNSDLIDWKKSFKK